MIENLRDIFEKYEDEYLKFHLVENKLSDRRDVHLFMTLDKIFKPQYKNENLIEYCEDDGFVYFCIKPETLAMYASEEEIRDLIRAGLGYSIRGMLFTII